MRRRFTAIYYIITISINGGDRLYRIRRTMRTQRYTRYSVFVLVRAITMIYTCVVLYADSRHGRLECSRDDLERRRRDRSPSESRSRAVRLRGLCAAAANDDGGAMNNNIVLLLLLSLLVWEIIINAWQTQYGRRLYNVTRRFARTYVRVCEFDAICCLRRRHPDTWRPSETCDANRHRGARAAICILRWPRTPNMGRNIFWALVRWLKRIRLYGAR